MDAILPIVLVIVGFFVFMRILVWVNGKIKKGKKIPSFSGEIGQRIQKGDKLLLYFYTPSCGACKAMTPVVDEMIKEKNNVYKINLAKDADIMDFNAQFEHALRLFNAIIEELREVCLKKRVKLTLVLMPGKSYVQRPGSTSAQFQDYLRAKIVENSEMKNIPTIDRADRLGFGSSLSLLRAPSPRRS